MIDDLLTRLNKVKRTGSGQWIACCSAHDDKSPSMTIREMPDGRVLLHCFAGCEVHDILAAVGLDFDALFPDQPIEYAKGERVPFNPRDVLRALAHEAAVVLIASSQMQQGKPLSEVDHKRLIKAVGRINTAAEACHV
jgi:hypothetical protein